VIPFVVHHTIAGPKGRGFKSHSHQHIFCFLCGLDRDGYALDEEEWSDNFLVELLMIRQVQLSRVWELVSQLVEET
jgi:hypothetical protein